VKKEYRNLNLGFRLKLAQRERALAKGIELVTWTFDPLQSRNAYLNFAKLGVISNSYRINFYGETSSSFLHANVGTDRLWVEWLITSARVRRRIEDRNPISSANERFTGAATLVSRGDDLRPILLMPGTLNQTTLLIEIPVDMGKIQATNPTLAVEWRLATREAFTRAIDAGYSVQEFHRIDRDGSRVGVYELARAITPVQES
jgi:predicted GNAT superfamily acetyltransferase